MESPFFAAKCLQSNNFGIGILGAPTWSHLHYWQNTRNTYSEAGQTSRGAIYHKNVSSASTSAICSTKCPAQYARRF
eukprot:8099843-Ditylum_brightwellii.AAC.1